MHKLNSPFGLSALILVFVILSACLSAEAVPLWRQRIAEQVAEQIEEEVEEELVVPAPQRQRGPFLWIFAGFILTAFVMSL